MIEKEPELGPLQREFSRCIAKLIEKITADGLECTFGEALRTEEQAAINSLSLTDRAIIRALLEKKYPILADAIGKSTSVGIKNSVHRNRLAIDLQLFRNGIWLSDASDYIPYGAFWKGLNPLARWGGDFGDADHFSFTYQGAK